MSLRLNMASFLPRGMGVLSGITHRTVLEIATELGLQVDIRPVPHTVFLDADDVFYFLFCGWAYSDRKSR